MGFLRPGTFKRIAEAMKVLIEEDEKLGQPTKETVGGAIKETVGQESKESGSDFEQKQRKAKSIEKIRSGLVRSFLSRRTRWKPRSLLSKEEE